MVIAASYDWLQLVVNQLDDIACHADCRTCGMKLNNPNDCLSCFPNFELQTDGSCKC